MTRDLRSWTFDELRRLLPGAERALDFRLSYALVDGDGRLRMVPHLVALGEGLDLPAPRGPFCSHPVTVWVPELAKYVCRDCGLVPAVGARTAENGKLEVNP